MDCSKTARNYSGECVEKTIELVETLCAIPAPLTHEGGLVAFCCEWFIVAGAEDVYVD